MHLASFSFSASSTVRGVAENDVVLLLVDEIMVDGFVTQGEALLVTQPADLLTEVEASKFTKCNMLSSDFMSNLFLSQKLHVIWSWLWLSTQICRRHWWPHGQLRAFRL